MSAGSTPQFQFACERGGEMGEREKEGTNHAWVKRVRWTRGKVQHVEVCVGFLCFFGLFFLFGLCLLLQVPLCVAHS